MQTLYFRKYNGYKYIDFAYFYLFFYVICQERQRKKNAILSGGMWFCMV